MISYCPLEPDVPQQLIRRQQQAVAAKNTTTPIVSSEDTECNYLVLFFILGVMILAASDSISIRR